MQTELGMSMEVLFMKTENVEDIEQNIEHGESNRREQPRIMSIRELMYSGKSLE